MTMLFCLINLDIHKIYDEDYLSLNANNIMVNSNL